MSLSHLNDSNQAAMVDVSGKAVTARRAVAEARVTVNDAVAAQFNGTELISKKGPVFQTAILAGVMGAKQTPSLIPLCHPLPLDNVTVELRADASTSAIEIEAICAVTARTGVEMEALTAVTVAALTVYDMCKAIDRGMRIEAVRLVRKEGGRSGVWTGP